MNTLRRMFSRDPRVYQIVTLAGLLLYGMLQLGFDITPLQAALLIGVALATQFALTRFFRLPSFDPRSPTISALSLCLLLRTNSHAIAAAAAFVAIASKFLLRWNGSTSSTRPTLESSRRCSRRAPSGSPPASGVTPRSWPFSSPAPGASWSTGPRAAT